MIDRVIRTAADRLGDHLSAIYRVRAKLTNKLLSKKTPESVKRQKHRGCAPLRMPEPKSLLSTSMPAALVARLNAEIVRLLHTAEVRDKLLADGSEAVGNSPAAFAAQIRAEFQRWAKVVKESGAHADD